MKNVSKMASEGLAREAEVEPCGMEEVVESREPVTAAEGAASRAEEDVPCSRIRSEGMPDGSPEETVQHMGCNACHMERRACQHLDSAAAPEDSRHWHTGSYGCSGSTWAGCGCDEYTNAADANTAAAALVHCLCVVPDPNPYLLALYLHPFHQHLLAWAAQPADDDSSCRLGVHEAAAKLTTASKMHWDATRC